MTITDADREAAEAWNAWWNSVSTGANDKHMQTAFLAGFEAAYQNRITAEQAGAKAIQIFDKFKLATIGRGKELR